MHTLFRIVAIYLGISLFLFNAQCQNTLSQFTISQIHPLESIKNHYLDLQAYSPKAQEKMSWMDDISFPDELYTSGALLLAMSQPTYLSTEQVAFLKQSLQFPANSSEQTRKELDFLLELQSKRSPEQVERVLYLAQIGYWPQANYLSSHPDHEDNLADLFFECQEVMGKDCKADNYPHTSKLLQGVMRDMRIMEFSVKFQLLRARPYQLEKKLDPLQRMRSPSFASGHTLWAYIQAFTFSELIPEKRQAFLDLAYEIALSREIMGVHYPSDEEAARQLAHRMLALMWHTASFQNDFQKAKAEWK